MAKIDRRTAVTDEVHESLCDILEQQGATLERSDMTGNADLIVDCGFDSLDIVELAMNVEEKFACEEISETAVSRWKSIADVEGFIRKAKEQ